MPYIGNTAGNRFVASKAASVYSGDGSETVFTLEHSVASDEDILVSVDGVIQEPSVAYAVSSGTTLTFTAAPSSNSGNNIFVYYLFRTVATVDHPSTSSLQATDGTFSSTLNVTGETTLATHLNMGDGDIIKLGDSGDLQIQHTGSLSSIVDSGTGSLFIGGSTAVGIMNSALNEYLINAIADGAVELYHDNSKKFQTTSSGVTVTGDIANASGDFTLDVDGDITLDADGQQIFLKNGGTHFGTLLTNATPQHFYIDCAIQDGDLIFRGNDGGSNITALTLNMSEGGDATFNGKVIADTFTKSDDDNTQINFLGSDVTQFKNGNSESARFIATTFFKQTNANGTYRDSTGQFNEFNTDRSGDSVLTCQMSHASYAGGGFQSIGTRAAAGDTYRLIECYSGNAADREFRVDSDGSVHADGSYVGTGADYAEMFEWKDGNTSSEDRVGKTVVLDGDKIRLSTSDDKEETIIGVVSATPVVLGDAQSEKWKEKYATDDYGRYIFEEYTQTEWIEEVDDGAKNLKTYNTDKIPSDVTVPKDAKVTSKDENGDNLKRRKLNTAFDASKTYIPRENRKEFSAIGLVGKLRVNVGQTVGDRWIKMREISDTVHEYLVR